VIRGSDVTVVIPTIPGREDLYRRAVDSVRTQDVHPGFVQAQLDVDRRGAAWARNQALGSVETDWVAWLDDDDELKPNHVKVLVRGANASGADLVYTYAEFRGGRDPLAQSHGGVLVPEPVDLPFDAEAEWSLRRWGNFIPVTYMVRTELVRRVGGFPEPYGFEASVSRDCEDYGLLLRLLDAGARFHHVPGVRTWVYHYHEGNLGGRGVNRMHELGGTT